MTKTTEGKCRSWEQKVFSIELYLAEVYCFFLMKATHLKHGSRLTSIKKIVIWSCQLSSHVYHEYYNSLKRQSSNI